MCIDFCCKLTNGCEYSAAEEHGAEKSPVLRSLEPYGLELVHLFLHLAHYLFLCTGGVI